MPWLGEIALMEKRRSETIRGKPGWQGGQQAS